MWEDVAIQRNKKGSSHDIAFSKVEKTIEELGTWMKVYLDESNRRMKVFKNMLEAQNTLIKRLDEGEDILRGISEETKKNDTILVQAIQEFLKKH